MDLLRLIKLKKLNGDLDNLNDKEQLFFSFFNNKVCHNDVFFDIEDDLIILYFIETKKELLCSYSRMWYIFEVKYNLNNKQIQELIKSIVYSKLGIELLNVRYFTT